MSASESLFPARRRAEIDIRRAEIAEWRRAAWDHRDEQDSARIVDLADELLALYDGGCDGLSVRVEVPPSDEAGRRSDLAGRGDAEMLPPGAPRGSASVSVERDSRSELDVRVRLREPVTDRLGSMRDWGKPGHHAV